MGCVQRCWSIMVCQGAAGRGRHHDNRVAKGVGTTRGKGKERACDEPVCMSSCGSVCADARAVVRMVEGVGAG